VNEATREVLMVLAVAVLGVVLAGAIALTPWHPRPPATAAVVEVHSPGR
jgi:hypothetical protein